MKNGTYAWHGAPDDAPALLDVSLKVPKGSLCIVVGGAGSGKSSLLAAMLGEMAGMHGSTSTTGSIAYAAQVCKPKNGPCYTP
jgi:ABC-type Mn2+/Zn2+ transport system ATPase subunit